MEPLNLAAILGIRHLGENLAHVRRELRRTLVTDESNLGQALARLQKHSGKQLRASLVIAAATLQGQKIDNQVITAASAVELVHLGSLVHDDIIDKSPNRWNQTTINDDQGIAQAIVVGDYLLAKACQRAADVNPEAAKLIALTIAQMSEGQSRELAELYNPGRSIDSMMQAVEAKTAALISAACQVGAICVGSKVAEIAALGKFGRSLGIAFQLSDDLLDLVSTEKLLGKPVNSDAAAGIYTLPVLLSLNGPQATKLKKLLIKKSPQDGLVDLLIKDGSLEKTIRAIQRYNALAQKELEGLENNKITKNLGQLPAAYLNWALNNLVAEVYRPTISQFLY